ncbi:hypothetical protein SPF06_19835, partial [Sinomonas sp. JGH33]
MEHNRRNVLRLIAGAAMAPLAVQAAISPASAESSNTGLAQRDDKSVVTLVSGGKALAVVVVANDADTVTRAAAADLVRVIGIATGVQLPQSDYSQAKSAFPGMVPINVGPVPENTETPLVKQLDQEGFVIHVWPDAVNIVGATSAG